MTPPKNHIPGAYIVTLKEALCPYKIDFTSKYISIWIIQNM